MLIGQQENEKKWYSYYKRIEYFQLVILHIVVD